MEELDEQGMWWLPSQPDRKVAGRLTYTVENGTRLSLNGSFREMWENETRVRKGVIRLTEEDLLREGRYPRIHGQVGSNPVTLDDCFRTRIKADLFGGLPLEEVFVNRAYRGVWFDADEEASGHKIAVHLLHLVYWMHRSGLSEEVRTRAQSDGNASDPAMRVEGHSILPIEVALPESVSLRIGQTLTLAGDGVAERSIRQDFRLRFEVPEIRPLRDLVALVSDAQDIISIGLDRTACLQSVVLSHPDLVEERSEGRALDLPIDVFAQWRDRAGWREPKRLFANDMLYSMADLNGSQGLGRLLVTASEFRTELSRIMATREAPSMYASDRLLNRAAALESFDRVSTSHTTSRFEARIRRCMVLAGPPFERLVRRPDEWVALFKTRRDLTAHHLSRLPAEDGFLDHIIAETAYYLFVMCLLRKASVPNAVFGLVERNSQFQWVAKQVPAILGVVT